MLSQGLHDWTGLGYQIVGMAPGILGIGYVCVGLGHVLKLVFTRRGTGDRAA